MSENQAAEVSAQPQEVQLDPALVQSVQAIRAIATAHNLLDKGLFEHSKALAVHESLKFLRSLHEQCINGAIAHEQADLVPELKAYKEGLANNSKGE